MRAEALEQVAIILAGLPPPLVGEVQHERHGGVAERDRRGPRHRARHVGHAVVHYPVHLVHRIAVGGRLRGLEAPALVDRDVDESGAGLHLREHLARHQLRRDRPGNQHSADHHVGLAHQLGHHPGVGMPVLEDASEHVVEILQPRKGAVQNGHVRAHARGDPGRVGSHHAAADHDDAGRTHAGHAAHQHAPPAIGLLESPRPHLRRQPARNLGHGRQQRQAAAPVRHGLVGDGGAPALEQIHRLLPIGRKMQVGEQNLALAQKLALDGLRLLDLDDHLRPGEHLLGGFDDNRARVDVVGVGKARAVSGSGLNRDFVAAAHGLAGGVRGHADPELLRLDFGWTSDFHCIVPPFWLQLRSCITIRAQSD